MQAFALVLINSSQSVVNMGWPVPILFVVIPPIVPITVNIVNLGV